MIQGREERALAVRARGEAVVVVEKGVGARAVDSWSCSVLAGILFWSRGRVGRASGEALGRETRREEQSCARTQGRGEGSGLQGGGLSPLVLPPPPRCPRLGRNKGRK